MVAVIVRQSEPGHGDGNESHYADHSDSQQ